MPPRVRDLADMYSTHHSWIGPHPCLYDKARKLLTNQTKDTLHWAVDANREGVQKGAHKRLFAKGTEGTTSMLLTKRTADSPMSESYHAAELGSNTRGPPLVTT